MFSKAAEYAVKAMMYICSQQGRRVALNDIAQAIGSPVAFTAKILQKLRKGGLLVSSVGSEGGFLIPEGKDISVKDVILCIDNGSIFVKCVLGLDKCSDANPCPIHEQYSEIRRSLNLTMSSALLKNFANDLVLNKLFLK